MLTPAITGPTTPTIATVSVTTTRMSRTNSIRGTPFATAPRIVWTSVDTTAKPLFVLTGIGQAAVIAPAQAIVQAAAIVRVVAVPPTVLVAVAIGPVPAIGLAAAVPPTVLVVAIGLPRVPAVA